jgi:hypothetical protein
VSNNEQPRRWRRLRGTKVRKGEILRDSRGRVIDDAYVEGAVADALSKVTKGRRGHKA